MEIKLMKISGNQYKVANGTFYNESTPDAVIRVLENSRLNNQRVRIFYGDTETGRDWMETWDTIGTIGRSCGMTKIPLLVKNSRSMGGGAILDTCIVKITVDKKVVYKAEKYYLPEIEIKIVDSPCLKEQGYTHCLQTKENGICWNCKSMKDAENKVAFFKGERNRP